MRFLLDTHVLIWALVDPGRLSKVGGGLIADPRNDVLFSPASILEIAIKVRLGRRSFNFEPDVILSAATATGFVELPVSAAATLHVRHMPNHHRDPFDHLLVAQAIDAGVELLTADTALPAYSSLVRLV